MRDDFANTATIGGTGTGQLGLAEPLVSVSIVNFNYGAFVGDAIASLRAQTYGKFDCIVVDNGSTDDSRSVIRRSVAGDARFSVIELDRNYGHLGAAMQVLDRMRGEFVLFLDADDWLFPDYLATHLQVHLGMARPKALTTSNVIEVDSKGSILNSGPPAIEVGLALGKRGLRPPHGAVRLAAISDERYELLSRATGDLSSACIGWFFGAGSSNVYRRSVMEIVRPELQGRPCFAGVDGYFNIFCHAFTGSALIEIPLSAYRIHGRNDYTLTGSGDGVWNGSRDADDRSRDARVLALDTFLARAEQMAWHLGTRFFDCMSELDTGRPWLTERLLSQQSSLAAIGRAFDRLVAIFGEARVYQQLRKRFSKEECAAIVAASVRRPARARLHARRLEWAYKRDPNFA